MDVTSEEEFIRQVRKAANTRADPFLGPMVDRLFSGSSLRLSTEVESIRITRSKPKHLIMVSRDFISRYVTTADDLLFLILHEMVHKFHTDDPDVPRYEQLDPDTDDMTNDREIYESIKSPEDLFVASMIEDIMVNARLCASYFPGAAPLFLKIYNIGRFPDVLMIPPVLLDWHRGRAIDLDPLYEPPVDNAEFDFNAMLEPEWHNRIVPVLDRVKNMPKLEIGRSEEKKFWNLDDDHSFWVKGIAMWYWKAWSTLIMESLSRFYVGIRPTFTEIYKLILLG